MVITLVKVMHRDFVSTASQKELNEEIMAKTTISIVN